MNFIDKLNRSWESTDSLLCVGLDPDQQRLPSSLGTGNAAIDPFCRAIVDATAPFVCAFKPQIAYFAAIGAERQLETIIRHIQDNHPEVPVILDAKRGDIGSTAGQYAREAFERYGADAVTVNPYMGSDAIAPYGQFAGKGVFLLCRTSNVSGDEVQNLMTSSPDSGEAIPVFQAVASHAVSQWNQLVHGQAGLVVGATYPNELRAVRGQVGDMPLLVPGIGAQGGDIDATVACGLDSRGFGMLINSSRAILYASGGGDFAQAAAQAARTTRDAINQARLRHFSAPDAPA